MKSDYYLKGTLTPQLLTDAGREHFLALAERLAADAHAGQKYGVFPYMYHVHGVAAAVANRSAEAMIVAFLHDILEDSDLTEEGLRAHGFPWYIVDAVVLLTRPDDLTYADYIGRLIERDGASAAYPYQLARAVKVADLQFNLRHNPPTARMSRYHNALERINEFNAATMGGLVP